MKNADDAFRAQKKPDAFAPGLMDIRLLR